MMMILACVHRIHSFRLRTLLSYIGAERRIKVGILWIITIHRFADRSILRDGADTGKIFVRFQCFVLFLGFQKRSDAGQKRVCDPIEHDIFRIEDGQQLVVSKSIHL